MPQSERGYGKRLGNKDGTNLTDHFKIKLREARPQMIYQLIRIKNTMKMIVICVRDDDMICRLAQKRIREEEKTLLDVCPKEKRFFYTIYIRRISAWL